MKIKFGNTVENIVTRKEFPLKKAQKVLKGKTIAVLGYGIQGPAQALNMRNQRNCRSAQVHRRQFLVEARDQGRLEARQDALLHRRGRRKG